MHDHRTRHRQPQAKSLARLAAEAAFSAPGSPPDNDVSGAPAPASASLAPPRVVAGTLHVIEPGAAASLAAATAAAAASAARKPRVFRLQDRTPVQAPAEGPGTAVPAAAAALGAPGTGDEAAPAETTAGAPVRRRRRTVAPPVTVIYRAPEQPQPAPAAASTDADTESGPPPGSPRDLAELQAGIEAEMAMARRAAEFDFTGAELKDEWAQLQREIERLSSELAQAEPADCARIV